MFDIYLGTKDIFIEERKFLLTVKRVLPRWVTSIPDSEYFTIYDYLPLLNTK